MRGKRTISLLAAGMSPLRFSVRASDSKAFTLACNVFTSMAACRGEGRQQNPTDDVTSTAQQRPHEVDSAIPCQGGVPKMDHMDAGRVAGGGQRPGVRDECSLSFRKSDRSPRTVALSD